MSGFGKNLSCDDDDEDEVAEMERNKRETPNEYWKSDDDDE